MHVHVTSPQNAGGIEEATCRGARIHTYAFFEAPGNVNVELSKNLAVAKNLT